MPIFLFSFFWTHLSVIKYQSDSDAEMGDATKTAAVSSADAAQKKRKADAEAEAEGSSKKAKTADAPAADSSETSSVFVGSLSWNIDEAWLRSEFEGIGEIVSARVVTERDTGRSKG